MHLFKWLRVIVLLLLCQGGTLLLGNLTAFAASDPGITAPQVQAEYPQVSSADPGQKNNGENQASNQTSQHIDTSKVDKFWNDLHEKYGGYLPNMQNGDIFHAFLPGNKGFGIKGVIEGIVRFVFHELWSDSKLLGTILILGLLAALLTTMQSAFESNMVSKLSYYVCYMVLIVLAITSFNTAIGYAKQAIQTMVDFMAAMIPMMLTMLASVGNITTVTLFHPLMAFIINITSAVVLYVVFPLLFFSAILNIVSGLSDSFKFSNLAGLIRTVSLTLLGVLFMFFLGIISVEGAIGTVTDSYSIKAAKFLASNFIPVVGKMFSDATETVIGASLLVKNAVGLGGVLIVLFICAFPSIQILSLSLIYNLASALIQPLGNSPIVSCLSQIGKSMSLVFAALATVGLMFFISITMIIAASNLSVMMR
ncbi:stage III sporulation protein AE [Fodinisporobacter ferrooxydans]|uniref:Stage III sporulation protein AE n=1 Tax=Fodinisporobacter ferrooxydans TaxID=2901836 RepID=A0ABY4CHW7_9BACL|nr:stage III sporulation protein AE [Alicyclobacillaceae bacterium MYW30-H2]